MGLEINAVQASLGAEKKRAEELEARVKNFSELLDRLDSWASIDRWFDSLAIGGSWPIVFS